MNKPPRGWPRITPAVYYAAPSAAIDWLCRAFGFTVRLKVEGEGGRIDHAELAFDEDGLIMIGTAGPGDKGKEAWRQHYASPQLLNGQNTQGLAIFVDDADAHCARARAAGAQIFREPRTTDYGEEYWADRTYGALDLEGHQWWFMQRVREPKGAGPTA
jgi:uncharacterized glyoxalase superfamily protein PhnB